MILKNWWEEFYSLSAFKIDGFYNFQLRKFKLGVLWTKGGRFVVEAGRFMNGDGRQFKLKHLQNTVCKVLR